MKTKQILFIFFFFSIFITHSQESKKDSISSIIEEKYSVIKEKEKETNFILNFITELKKADIKENAKLIEDKNLVLNKLKLEILLIKEEILKLIESQISTNEFYGINSTKNSNELSLTSSKIKSKFNEHLLNIESKKLFRNSKITYKATIWNTNFSIPIARFNFKKDDDTKLGDIQLFNSIGAGFGISLGTMIDFRDENGELENSDFSNSFSIHGGFLFSAGSENNNVFAPVLTFGFLDFQLGFGVELGTLKENQRRGFLTLGYAIPLYKLTKGKYLFFRNRKGKIINEVYFDN